MHTHTLGGVDVLFGVMTFDLIFHLLFEAIIIDLRWQMMSSVSEKYIGKRLLDCFHTAHTHIPQGVHMWLLGVMTLDLILRPLLTLIYGVLYVQFPADILQSVCWILFYIAKHTSIRWRCAFWGVRPLN